MVNLSIPGTADDGFGNLIAIDIRLRNSFMWDTSYRDDPLLETVCLYDCRTKMCMRVLKAPLYKHGIKYANP